MKKRSAGTGGSRERSRGAAAPTPGGKALVSTPAGWILTAVGLLLPIAHAPGPFEPYLSPKWLLAGLFGAGLAGLRGEAFAVWLRDCRNFSLDSGVALLAFWAALSSLWSATPLHSLETWLRLAGPALIFVHLRLTPEDRPAAWRGLLLAAGINLVAALLQQAGMVTPRPAGGEGPLGLVGNSNHLGLFLAAVFPVAVAGWRRPGLLRGTAGAVRRGGSPRLAGIAGAMVVVVFLLVLGLTRSRGAWIAAACGAAMLPGAWRARRGRLLRLLLLGGFVATAVLAVTFGMAGKSRTVQTRWLGWRVTVSGWSQAPLLGSGLGTFGNQFARLQQAHFRGLFEDPARLARDEWRLARNNRQAHNDFFQVQTELGLPGLVLVLVILGSALRASEGSRPVEDEKTTGKDPPRQEPSDEGLCRASVSALAAGALTGFPLYQPATLLTAAVALSGCGVQLPPSEGPAPPVRWATGLVLLLAVALGLGSIAGYTADVLYGRGRAQLQAGQWAEAEGSLRSALAWRPHDGRARTSLGRALHAQGRSSEALDEFRRAARYHLDAAVLSNQAVALESLGRGDEAFPLFLRAAETLPSDTTLQYLLGLAYSRRGDLDEAEAALARAVDLSADNHAARLEAGRLALRRRGDPTPMEDNIVYLDARMSQEDPSGRTADPEKRDFLALSCRELSAWYLEAGRPADAGRVRSVGRRWGIGQEALR